MAVCAIATKFHSVALLTHSKHKSKVPVKRKTHFFCYCPLITLCKLSGSPANRTWPRSYPFACSCSCTNNNDTFPVQADGTVRVKLILHKECEFGEEFSAVGEEPILGSWDPLSAIPMTWAPGHIWATPTMGLPVGKRISFKFILTDREGEIQWQPGPDRVFETWETRALLLVSQDWDDINLQTITEEEMDEQVIRVTQQGITVTGGEDWVRETQEAGVDIAKGGAISGEVPVLLPGLTSVSDADGDCSTIGEVPILVPGLRTVFDEHGDCLAKEVENTGNSSVAIMAAAAEEEEEEEEEESLLFVENGSATLNYASLSGEDEASTPNATKTSVVIEEEETSISSAPKTSVVIEEEETSTSSAPKTSVVIEEEETSTSSATKTSVGIEEEETSTSSAKELIENKDTGASSESSGDEGDHSNMVNYEPDSSVLEKDFDWGRGVLSKLMGSLGLRNG